MASFVVPADHPALPGHFPGNPLVPGVVLLEHVLDAAAAELGPLPGVAELVQVKFLAPLRPGARADVSLERTPGRMRFRVGSAGTPLASGEFRLRAEAPP